MSATTLLKLGKQASKEDDNIKAEHCFRVCVQTHDHVDCNTALGEVLVDLERFAESHGPFFHAIQLKNTASHWANLKRSYLKRGVPEMMYVDMGDLQVQNAMQLGDSALLFDAETQYQKALEVNSKSADAHMHLYNLYSGPMNNPTKAIKHLELLLRYQPNNPAALYTVGTQFFAKQDFDNALDYFSRAAASDPTLGPAVSNRFYLRKRVCEWGSFDKDLVTIKKLIKTELKDVNNIQMSVHPYMAVSYDIDPKLKLELARRMALRELQSALAMGMQPFSHNHETRKRHRRLRVGYISTDFRMKATAYLIQNMYGNHNRDKYQIFCFALTEDDSSMWRRRIESQCENFIDVSAKDPMEIANAINSKYQIDILVDMDGYCNEGIRKTEILAVRPAPVQMHLLVYPSTMGADFIDYLVGDPHTTPPQHYNLYHEKLLVMPHSYFINSHNSLTASSQIASAQLETEPDSSNALELVHHVKEGVEYNTYGETRFDYGLPNHAFVFCSFNSHYKLDPTIWTIWMDLLKQIEGSILWILRFPPESEHRLREEAEKRGIDSYQRIVFSEYIQDPERNLRRLRFADIILDTFNYGAHTGCADALFAGVPVVTLAGNYYASRVCTAQLRVVGLGQLVANTTDQYKQVALNLATDRELLRRSRDHLDSVRETTPLFDTKRYVKNLEKGYDEMWATFMAGHAPNHVIVKDTDDHPSKGKHEEL